MSKKFVLKKNIPRHGWDPTIDADRGTLTATASSRIKRDLLSIFTEPPPGLYVVGEENNLKIVHALIMGVMDTPYEGGFFYFILKCPNDYPIHPPKVKLMTTDGGTVRFNPNMYRSGKICLSILGTWEGPSWSPAQQLSSLLLSIQSLMCEQPYYNEPGFDKEEVPGDSKRYNEYIQYETLRVSVCGMLENECRLMMPEQLRDIMEKSFLEFYDQYVEIVKTNMHLDGNLLIDPFSKDAFTCCYSSVLKRLETLRTKLLAKRMPLNAVLSTDKSVTETATRLAQESTESQAGNNVKKILTDPAWFNADQPCDDEVEVDQLEQEHQNWLSSISQRNADLIPIGKTATETLDEEEEDDDEDDNDDDDESETHDEEDEDEIEMEGLYDPNSSVGVNIRVVQEQ